MGVIFAYNFSNGRELRDFVAIDTSVAMRAACRNGLALHPIFGRPRRVGRVLSSPQKQLRCTVHPDYGRRRRHWLRWC